MEKLQALLQGLHVRRELVLAVREEYEKIVCEVEGDNPKSVVRWPKKKALCFPAFSDSVYQPATDRAGEMREKGLTPEHVDNNIQAQPPLRQKSEDSISLTSLSSLSSNQREEATTAEQQSPTNTQNYTEMKEGEGENVETSYLTNFNESADALVELLHAGPLVKGDLPRSRESLQELRLQTEMELMWLRQAIASRRKYLQLKEEIKTRSSS